MASQATVEIVGNNKGLDKSLDESQALVNKFASGVKVALGAAAAAFAFNKIVSTVGGWISDASEAEKATAKLAAVLQATGGTVGFTSDQLAEMADQMEKLTGIQAESVQQAQALLLTFRNVKGDEFAKATELAADLAAVLESDVSAAAKILGKALDDPGEGLNALRRAGLNFTMEQEEVIRVMAATGDIAGAQQLILKALEGQVGGVAKAMGETFGGRVAILQAHLGDVGETIGTAILPLFEAMMPSITLAANSLTYFISTLSEVIAGGQEFGVTLSDVFESTMRFIVSVSVFSFQELLAFFESWNDRASSIMTSFLLTAVSSFESLKYTLTVTMPEYLKWFGENWQSVFKDIANFTGVVFSNLWKNVSDFFSSLSKWLSGEETSFKFTGLTEGFESSLKELPKIAERELSQLELSLKSQIETFDANVDSVYERRRAEGQKIVDDLFSEKKKEEIKSTATDEYRIATAAEKAEKSAAKEVKDEKPVQEKPPQVVKDEKPAQETAPVSGQVKGLEELSKSIESATGSNAQKIMEDLSASQKEALNRQLAFEEYRTKLAQETALGIRGVVEAISKPDPAFAGFKLIADQQLPLLKMMTDLMTKGNSLTEDNTKAIKEVDVALQ